jgi:large subunit ribosomal protein L20
MIRVKRGKIKHKRKKKIFSQTKGFHWGRKSVYKRAKEALIHALADATIGRKLKKRNFRRLWQVRINAALAPLGITYSRFIHLLKEAKIDLNRKILATLAKDFPEVFQEIVNEVKNASQKVETLQKGS